MKTKTRKNLDQNFEAGKNFLISHPSLLNEMADSFEKEMRASLRKQSYLTIGEKIALPQAPGLKKDLKRQILFAWGLGYAIGLSDKNKIKDKK